MADGKYGFRRWEMYKSNLAGTVDAYDRHVFLYYNNHQTWSSKFDDSHIDLLPKLLSKAIKSRKDDLRFKTRFTVAEVCEGSEFADGDVLIFPDLKKFRGLTDSNVDSFVEDVLVNEKPWSGGQEGLSGSYVFVCAHANRDKRCGVCGPILVEKFKEEIESRGLQDQVFVRACSHTGGHKYAGNLIIFSPDSEGKIVGHWYGYVTPNDVPELVDQHIGNGEIIERLWRGQMGVYSEESGTKHSTGKFKKNKRKHEEGSTQPVIIKQTVTSCCQEGGNGSCCQEQPTGPADSSEKTGPGKLSTWMGTVWQKFNS